MAVDAFWWSASFVLESGIGGSNLVGLLAGSRGLVLSMDGSIFTFNLCVLGDVILQHGA